MFLLNLKIAFRNLFKNKLYAFINMGGLAMGMLSFILISLYINYEKTFDQWSPDLERVYVGEHQYRDQQAAYANAVFSYNIMDLVTQKVKNVSGIALFRYEHNIVAYQGKKQTGITIASISNNYFSVFPHTVLMGDAVDKMNRPDAAVITQECAVKIFGSTQVLGKSFSLINGNKQQTYTVAAVLDSKANRSVWESEMYIPIQKEKDIMYWGNSGFSCFVKLDKDADAQAVFTDIQQYYSDAMARFFSSEKKLPDALMTTVNSQAYIKASKIGYDYDRVQFSPVRDENLKDSFKRMALYTLQSLSILLMLIVCINFTNVAVVQAGKRAKEVGIRKVLGGGKPSLIFQFMIEALLPCLLSLIVALVAADLLLPTFKNLIEVQKLDLYDIAVLRKLLSQMALLFAFVLLAVGLYPSLFIASFLPIKVLKGNFNTSSKGVLLRKILIVIQFTISGIFLMSYGVMYSQTAHLRKVDMGMNLNNVVMINLNGKLDESYQQFESVETQLKQIEGVEYASRGNLGMIGGNASSGAAYYGETKGTIEDGFIDPDYFKVFDISVLAGRGFSKNTLANDTAAYSVVGADVVFNVVVNETMIKQFGIKKPYLNEIVKRNGVAGRIIGVIKDVKRRGVNAAAVPVYYTVLKGDDTRSYLFIRLDGKHNTTALASIKKLWETQVDPGLAITYTYMTTRLDNNMKPYTRLATIMLLFSIVTFIITLLGIFALAAYTARMRTREIAVRRVMGASVQDILLLLNKDFIRLTLIGSAIAIVAAYLLMQKWLAQFAYRIDMPYWIFVCVALLLLLVTIITVTLQGIQSARTKPVTALSYE